MSSLFNLWSAEEVWAWATDLPLLGFAARIMVALACVVMCATNEGRNP
jgi:hypothetical protein